MIETFIPKENGYVMNRLYSSRALLFSNHLDLPMYDESSFWRGARSHNISPIDHRESVRQSRRLIGMKHSLRGSALNVGLARVSNECVNIRGATHSSRSARERDCQATSSHEMIPQHDTLRNRVLYDVNTNYEPTHQQNYQASYSSSDTDSQDPQGRIPKYNSQVLGTSTRSLIQQVLDPHYYSSIMTHSGLLRRRTRSSGSR